MKTYVLGCGPAGLAAAHAATLLGEDVTILSRARKSQMFGAQYLHSQIPKIFCGGETTVQYTLRGTTEQYRRKVYGESFDGTVSPQALPERHSAWDIRAAYDDLWKKYAPLIQNVSINNRWMQNFMFSGPPKRVISSVPLPFICRDWLVHQFNHIRIWAAGEAPEIGKLFPREDGVLKISGIELRDSNVICNGFIDPWWYRASLIFGRATVEWPWDPGFFLPEEEGSIVKKPISTNCDCWPNVLRVGRYGTWTKGVLVHHAFEETAKWISSQ